MTLHMNRVNRQPTEAHPDIDWLSPAELARLADKVDQEKRLTSSDRAAIADVLRRVRNAQNQWNYAHSPAYRGHRGSTLVNTLKLLLNKA